MKRRKKQNLSLGIIAGIGIILILSAFWIFSKGHRFKNYHNERTGFSIKYPVDWAQEETGIGNSVIFLSAQENELDIFRENVSVVVQDLSGNPMALKEYSELAIHQMEVVFKENLIILVSEPAFFGKRKGYKFEFLGKGPDAELHYLIYWTIRGMTAYQVTYTAISSKYDRYLSKVKKMIRSFHIE